MDKSEFTRELFSKSYLTVETLKKLYKTMKLLVEGFKVKFETVESSHTFSIKIYILKSDLSQEDSAVVKELLKRTV